MSFRSRASLLVMRQTGSANTNNTQRAHLLLSSSSSKYGTADGIAADPPSAGATFATGYATGTNGSNLDPASEPNSSAGAGASPFSTGDRERLLGLAATVGLLKPDPSIPCPSLSIYQALKHKLNCKHVARSRQCERSEGVCTYEHRAETRGNILVNFSNGGPPGWAWAWGGGGVPRVQRTGQALRVLLLWVLGSDGRGIQLNWHTWSTAFHPRTRVALQRRQFSCFFVS